MARKKKEEIIRPKIFTVPVAYEYECPSCKKKVTRTFSMITPIKANVQTIQSYWCKNQICGAIHRITYRLFKKRNGRPKIKVFNFTSNGKAYNKRFRLLEPTTKGEKKI